MAVVGSWVETVELEARHLEDDEDAGPPKVEPALPAHSRLGWALVLVLSLYILAGKAGLIGAEEGARHPAGPLAGLDPAWCGQSKGLWDRGSAAAGELAAAGWRWYKRPMPDHLRYIGTLPSSLERHSGPELVGHAGHELGHVLFGAGHAGRSASSRSLTGDGHNGSDSNASAADQAGGSHGGGGSHQYDALLFLFNAFLLGAAVTYLREFALFRDMQEAVVLFVVGVVYALIMENLTDISELGPFGHSYVMWMNINPEIILFTMLPPLLAADAMNIDTTVALRVAQQCFYLAGPGILVNGFLTALFLHFYLPYDWPFLLCLVVGAILSATDPLAVIGLLKELGASPTLTVQIQGESLLNDGTAIVFYGISYRMLKGVHYEFSDIIVALFKTVLCAWALGCFVGWIFLLCIRASNNKLDHHSSMVQAVLTIICAYWSFYVSERIFGLSGVLACVAASLVLAHKMWHCLVSRESMHIVWHMLEYLANTVLFFLAGALTGRTMVVIPWQDYFHLGVIYVMLFIIRGAIILGSRPVLKALGKDKQEVSVAEALVMTWGGLRGSVGLALAIQVSIDRAGGEISERDGQRVLFYVSGVAALTLVINATTSPALVKGLGVTMMPEAKQELLLMLHQQLDCISRGQPLGHEVAMFVKSMLCDVKEHIDTMSVDHKSNQTSKASWRGSSQSSGTLQVPDQCGPLFPVKECTARASSHDAAGNKLAEGRTLAERATSEILTEGALARISRSPAPQPIGNAFELPYNPQARLTTPTQRPNTPLSAASGDSIQIPKGLNTRLRRRSSSGSEEDDDKRRRSSLGFLVLGLGLQPKGLGAMQLSNDIIKDLATSKAKLSMIPQGLSHQLGVDLTLTRGMELEMIHLIRTLPVDPEMSRAMNEAFLTLVGHEYWQMIERGDVVSGTNEAEVLLTSVKLALSQARGDLDDWRFIRPTFIKADIQAMIASRMNYNSRSHDLTGWEGVKMRVHTILESHWFEGAVMFAIILNAILIAVEETHRDETNESNAGWLIADIFFTTLFFGEFVLKFIDMGRSYFKRAWNVFDFTLVILGILGLLMNIVEEIQAAQGADVSADARLIRFARIFRAMRLMRLVRLVRFVKATQAKMNAMDFSQEVSEHMQKINVLKCFIKGHLAATKELIRFFGSEDSVEGVEMARCILQSQVSVYKAVCLAVAEETHLGKRMLRGVQNVRESKAVAEELSAFVMDAHAGGIITHREAHSIMHPLNQLIRICAERIQKSHLGYTEKADRSLTGSTYSKDDNAPFKKMRNASDFLRAQTPDDDDDDGPDDDDSDECSTDSESGADPEVQVVPGQMLNAAEGFDRAEADDPSGACDRTTTPATVVDATPEARSPHHAALVS